MSLAVIGAGVGRTGTHSLKVALERLLDAPCHHMVEVFPSEEQREGWTRAIDGEPIDWNTLLAGYRSIVDWPGGAFWRELRAANPKALVLLSTRDPASWYRSASNTIFIGTREAAIAGVPWMGAMMRLFANRFSDALESESAMIHAFEAHNAAVRAEVPPDQLLEWTPGDGWEPICARLGVPVPPEPFPQTNSTNEFRAMLGLDPVEP